MIILLLSRATTDNRKVERGEREREIPAQPTWLDVSIFLPIKEEFYSFVALDQILDFTKETHHHDFTITLSAQQKTLFFIELLIKKEENEIKWPSEDFILSIIISMPQNRDLNQEK